MAAPAQTMQGQRVQLPQTLADDIKRQQQMRKALDAYEAEVTEDEQPLKKKDGQPNFNVVAGRPAAIVDTGQDYLFGKPLDIDVEEAAPDEAQDYLDSAWGDEDKMMTRLAKLAINGAIFGHCFVQIVPPLNFPDAPPADALPEQKLPRLIILDPLCMTVQSDPDDYERVLSYTQEWTSRDDKGKQITKRRVTARVQDDTLGLGDEIDAATTWTITTYQQIGIGTQAAWLQLGEVIQWSHPFAPICDCQNMVAPNRFWGKPDLTKSILDISKAIALVESNINKIGWHHGHPWPWASGFNPDGTKPEPGELVALESPEARMGAVEAHGDIANLLNFAQNLRLDQDEDSAVPSLATGRITEIKAVTGVAMELLYHRIIAKTGMKRRLYGSLIRAISQYFLYFGGFVKPDGSFYDVRLAWPDILPKDNLQLAQFYQILVTANLISKHSAMIALGLDPDEEMELMASEDEQAMQKFAQGRAMPPEAQQFGQQPLPDDGKPQPPAQQGNNQQPEQEGEAA